MISKAVNPVLVVALSSDNYVLQYFILKQSVSEWFQSLLTLFWLCQALSGDNYALQYFLLTQSVSEWFQKKLNLILWCQDLPIIDLVQQRFLTIQSVSKKEVNPDSIISNMLKNITLIRVLPGGKYAYQYFLSIQSVLKLFTSRLT